jgi:hypothetical protein
MGLDSSKWDVVSLYLFVLCAFQFARLFVYYFFLRKVIDIKPLRLAVNNKNLILKIGPFIKSLYLSLIPIVLYGLMLLIFIPNYEFQSATDNYAPYIMIAILLISIIFEILYFRKLNNANKWVLKYLLIIGISFLLLVFLGLLLILLLQGLQG